MNFENKILLLSSEKIKYTSYIRNASGKWCGQRFQFKKLFNNSNLHFETAPVINPSLAVGYLLTF